MHFILIWHLLSFPKLHEEFFNDKHESMFGYTQQGMNWQTTWYYVNHSSDKPNVAAHSTGHPRVQKYISVSLVALHDLL